MISQWTLLSRAAPAATRADLYTDPILHSLVATSEGLNSHHFQDCFILPRMEKSIPSACLKNTDVKSCSKNRSKHRSSRINASCRRRKTLKSRRRSLLCVPLNLTEVSGLDKPSSSQRSTWLCLRCWTCSAQEPSISSTFSFRYKSKTKRRNRKRKNT